MTMTSQTTTQSFLDAFAQAPDRERYEKGEDHA